MGKHTGFELVDTPFRILAFHPQVFTEEVFRASSMYYDLQHLVCIETVS